MKDAACYSTSLLEIAPLLKKNPKKKPPCMAIYGTLHDQKDINEKKKLNDCKVHSLDNSIKYKLNNPY